MPAAASTRGSAVAGNSGADFAADPTPGLFLTLFRDSAMIWDRRAVQLPPGRTEMAFKPVPDKVDTRTATLVSLTAPDSISVRAQPSSDDASVKALTWAVTTKSASEHVLEAAYVTPMITWRAHYRLHLRSYGPDSASAPSRPRPAGRLSGYLEISNHSDMPLRDVHLRVTDSRRSAPADDEGKPNHTDEPRFLHVPEPVTLAPRATALVPFMSTDSELWAVAHGLLYDPVARHLRGRARQPKLRRDFGLRDEENPHPRTRAILELGASSARAADSATLKSLPAGLMTVVADTERGNPRVVGSGPAFAIRDGVKSTYVELGPNPEPGGVEVTRQQTDFFRDDRAERLVEEIRITLVNRDSVSRRVLVREHMYRGRNWSVGYNNGVGTPRKVGVQTIHFDVEVAPGDSQTIIYRVVYTW